MGAATARLAAALRAAAAVAAERRAADCRQSMESTNTFEKKSCRSRLVCHYQVYMVRNVGGNRTRNQKSSSLHKPSPLAFIPPAFPSPSSSQKKKKKKSKKEICERALAFLFLFFWCARRHE